MPRKKNQFDNIPDYIKDLVNDYVPPKAKTGINIS
jgi:hypothetical protein